MFRINPDSPLVYYKYVISSDMESAVTLNPFQVGILSYPWAVSQLSPPRPFDYNMHRTRLQ